MGTDLGDAIDAAAGRVARDAAQNVVSDTKKGRSDRREAGSTDGKAKAGNRY
jgi:hypothetical protein